MIFRVLFGVGLAGLVYLLFNFLVEIGATLAQAWVGCLLLTALAAALAYFLIDKPSRK